MQSIKTILLLEDNKKFGTLHGLKPIISQQISSNIFK